MKPIMAIDVDGVLVDFTKPALEYINAHGRSKTVDQVTEFSVFDGDEDLEEAYKRDVVSQPGFCRSMEAYPGAVEFVRAVQKKYDVVIVMAPYDVPHWYEGRRDWLVEELGISTKNICFLSRKEFFDADVLIDDKMENVVGWYEQRSERTGTDLEPLPILVDQPWNQGWIPFGVHRSTSWTDISAMLGEHGFPRFRGKF